MESIEEQEKEARSTIFGTDFNVRLYYGERHTQHKNHISMIVHPDDVEYVKSILGVVAQGQSIVSNIRKSGVRVSPAPQNKE